MATEAPVLLPVDYKGTAPTNRVRGEQHILNKTDAQSHRVIIPKLAPFFNNQGTTDIRFKMNIVDPQTGVKTDLIEGVHYYPVFYFITASKATMRPLFGGVEFLDDSLEGTVTIEFYQSLGGIWTITASQIADILADLKYNPRRTSWDSIADLPERFPVVDHEWDYVDMTGQVDVVKALYAIRDQLVAQSGTGLTAHVNDKNNPHGTTKEHVNLGLVMNYALATVTQARAGLINTAYMTPSLTREAITEQAIKPLNAHIAEKNPHGLTPALLGSPTLAEHELKLDKTGTAANSTRFAGYTFPEAAVEILKGTAFNSDRIGGLTLEQIRAETSAGTIENAQRLQGHTLAEVLGLVPAYVGANYTSVAHAQDASTLGGVSLDELVEAIALMTVEDTMKFGGMTPEEYAEDIYSGLGENLGSATTANFNDVGLNSVQRMYFNDNRFFPIYRFNLQELGEWYYPPGLKGNVNHSMMLTPVDYNGVEVGTFILSVNTIMDLRAEQTDLTKRLVLAPCSIRSLQDTGVKLKIYVRKIGNDVGEIMFDRLAADEDGNEVLLSGMTITNVSSLSKFIARKDVFENESVATIDTTHYFEIPNVASTPPMMEPYETQLGPGASRTESAFTLQHLVQVFAREGDTGPYTDATGVIEVTQTPTGTTFRNTGSVILNLYVKIR